jgi:CheY-like chemotaxis protein
MAPHKKKNCLLIEDRTEDALLVQKKLAARPDLALHGVMDGEEAVRYLERKRGFDAVPSPDLILLDLKLPQMDGFSFLKWRQLSEPHRAIPVMVLSCLSEPEELREAHDLGVGSYLTKPINWERFGQELSRLTSSGETPLREQAVALPEVEPPVNRRVTCVLTFRNGNKVSVAAAAQFENQIVRFEYTGDVSQIRPFAERGTLGFLKWYLEGIAANLDAEIEIIEHE